MHVGRRYKVREKKNRRRIMDSVGWHLSQICPSRKVTGELQLFEDDKVGDHATVKSKSFRSHYQPNDKSEHLYMLEFLVDRLNLTPEKVADFGSTPVTVVLEFLDFPAFVMSESEFSSSRKRSEKRVTAVSKDRKSGGDGSLDLGAGKSCLFSRRPETLIEAMRSQPLKIGVYKRAPVTRICSREEPELAVCKTEVPLPGCLCDQVSMARNDEDHLPRPYAIRNTWNLIDQRGQPAGTILLFLKLTCLGQSMVKQFALRDDSLLFKSTNSSDEFLCARIPRANEDESRPEGYREPEMKPSSVIGLASVCGELAKRDGVPAEDASRREPPPHRWPDEICCVRRPASTLCSGAVIGEFPNAEENHYGGVSGDAGRTRAGARTGCEQSLSYGPRMRGGGPWNERTSCDDARTLRSMYRSEPTARVAAQSVDDLISGACKSPTKTADKPGCGCFGRVGTGATGTFKSSSESRHFGCANAPCQGIDCLIRAFKETEDFVESIGRVHGCAGLGLMDPADSPYFRRERDSPTSCHSKAPAAFPATHAARPMGKPDTGHDPFRSVASSPRLRKKIDERTTEKQREPEPASRPEPEVEPGPCGQTSCKSRRTEPAEASGDVDGTTEKREEPAKKISVVARSSNSHRPKQRVKSKSLTIPGSDHRASTHRNPHIRVSKRVMRLVDAYRDSRFCYGHKNCLEARVRVPGDMGWLWNSVAASPGRLKTPIGWKPGAVSKFVWERLQQARKAMLAESSSSISELRRASSATRPKRSRSPRSKSFHSLARSQWAKARMLDHDENEIELPPTLHVHRKDGTYYITMYPVRAEGAPDQLPTDDASKPLQFKVTKNRDEGDATSSSTGSDMEIEFSPPAALNRYRKKDPVADRDTQVRQQDILDALKVPEDAKRTNKPRKAKHKK